MKRKSWFLVAVVTGNLSFFIYFYPQTEIDALILTGRTILDFILMLTPIFIIIGLIDVWIERETMIKILGEKSGYIGVLASLLLGVVTAVPLYALLPVAGVLLKKGSRISSVMIFLCSSASFRIPLLLFEISSLGWKFTFIRFGLNLIVVFAITIIIEKSLSESDIMTIYNKANKL